jgi:hypothetical protein
MMKRDQELLERSATTYLLLVVWLGPKLAFSFCFVTLFAAVWIACCKRYQWFAVFTIGFIHGLLRR